MKLPPEVDYYYKTKDGRLQFALTTEMFFTILFFFWTLPIYAVFHFIWQELKVNVMILKKEDAHRHNARYYKNKTRE